MADVDKSLDDIILQRNFTGPGNRGRGRGRGKSRGRGGMRGGAGGRFVTQSGRGGGIQGIRGATQGGRGGVNRGRGGAQRGRGGVQGVRGGGGQNTWRGRGGGFRGGNRGGGGDRAFNQQPPQQVVAMPSPSQVNQSLARQATFSPQQTISVQLPDARDKLNFKARQTDARLRLNKKAQQTDARVKLNNKRKFSGEAVTPPATPQAATPQQQGQTPRNMAKIGLTQVTIKNPGAKANRIQTTPTQITIKNPQANRSQQQPGSGKKNKGGNIISLKKQTGNSPGLPLGGGGLKITTVNQAATQKRKAAAAAAQARAAAARAAALRVQAEEMYAEEEEVEEEYIPSPPKMRRETITRIAPPTTTGTVRIKPPPVVAPAPVRTRVSALERVSAPRVPATQRISSAPPAAVQGTRIIISNLHPVVSEEDIKELFGAIGTLVRARLVRPGLSEVIYVKREQALQAISTYHDRELDGQPMQCKLDTSSVPESKPAAAVPVPKTGMVTAATVAAASAAVRERPTSLSDRFKLYSRSNVELPVSGMRSDSIRDSTIDPSVIHKALFKTGVQANPSKPVLFTVKI